MTKKGQDLTRPGEKDDLQDIFKAQEEGYRNKRDAAKRRQDERSK